ncbi:MAG: hypothetical protein ACK5TK_06560, partial [Betaproteobacteria bacterium]
TAPTAQIEAAPDARAIASRVQVQVRGAQAQVRVAQTVAQDASRGLLVADGSARLQRAGHAYRIALPATAVPLPPQALIAEDGELAYLVVIPAREASGHVSVELRGSAEDAARIELGELAEDERIAFLIPLRDRAAAARVAQGAVEFEARGHGRSLWTTLPFANTPVALATAD